LIQYTIESLKVLFSEFNCTLLEESYINNRQYLKFCCFCGREDFKTVNSFKSNPQCRYCSGTKRDFNSVKKIYEDNNCILLENTYENPEMFMKFICSCGKEDSKRFPTFKNSPKCRICSKKDGVLGRSKKFDEIRFIFESSGNKLLSTEYIPGKKLEYICDCGKIDYKIIHEFVKGSRCYECGIKKMTGENHPQWVKDREKLAFKKDYSNKIRIMVKRCLQKFNSKKEDSSFDLLGYGPYDLGYHIVNHPNYKNAVKNEKMHIDHIFPIQAFIEFGLCDIEHIKVINSLENLQPLDAFDNLSKNDKYDPEAFIQFLKSKGINIET
jgi:hypothetical protein